MQPRPTTLYRRLDRRLRSSVENPKIFIQDILVSQKQNPNSDEGDYPYGEFSEELAFELKHSDAKLEKESDHAVTARMMKHLKNMAHEGLKIHLRENFVLAQKSDLDSPFLYPDRVQLRENAIATLKSRSAKLDEPDIAAEILREVRAGKVHVMKSDCRSRVIRVSFPEFSFYPNCARGALNAATFGGYLSQIEAFAKTLPENYHLLVSSVPFLNDRNELFNKVIYVQCGRTPSIHVSTKAVPSDADPTYGVTAPTFPGFDKHDQIEKITSFVAGYEPSAEFEKKRVLEEKLNRTNIDLARQQESFTREEKKRKFALECSHTKIADQLAQLNKKSAVLDWQPKENTQRKKSTTNYYGGIVVCTTAEGLKFFVVIDICLDHKYAVAMHAFARQIACAMKHGTQVISPFVTHVLTSNCYPVDSHHILGRTVLHAEPDSPTLFVASSETKTHILPNMPPVGEANSYSLVFSPPDQWKLFYVDHRYVQSEIKMSEVDNLSGVLGHRSFDQLSDSDKYIINLVLDTYDIGRKKSECKVAESTKEFHAEFGGRVIMQVFPNRQIDFLQEDILKRIESHNENVSIDIGNRLLSQTTRFMPQTKKRLMLCYHPDSCEKKDTEVKSDTNDVSPLPIASC